MATQSEDLVTCSSVQEQLRQYCQLQGIRFRYGTKGMACKMPRGVFLTVFNKPVFYMNNFIYYGSVFYPYREFCRRVYLDEKGLGLLSKRLGEQIDLLKNKTKEEDPDN